MEPSQPPLIYHALNDSPPASSSVESHDDHIYFYSDVTDATCLKLLQSIRECDTRLRAERVQRGLENHPPIPIWLHISSYGGSLLSAFNMADQLKLIKTPIYSVVEGIGASAATLISLATTKRYILPNSYMLIHQLRTIAAGTHEEFKDEMEFQKTAMKQLTKFYVAHTNVKKKELKKMLQHDYWMDAETCLELGFVDEILVSS